MPELIKYADKAVFRSEINSGIMRLCDWWVIGDEHPDAGLTIEPWEPAKAEQAFLDRAKELFGDVADATLWPPRS